MFASDLCCETSIVHYLEVNKGGCGCELSQQVIITLAWRKMNTTTIHPGKIAELG
jgi:hypothetical protein